MSIDKSQDRGHPPSQRVPQAPERPTSKRVRVTLIDDDELTTRGVATMLREHPEQIELVRLTRPLLEPIDIALFDHALRRPGGKPTLGQLLSDTRIRKVALFTWHFQPWAAADLVAQGASAYLSKGLTGTELVMALRAANADQTRVSPKGSLTRSYMANQAECGEVLTDRESEMLCLITRGLSNAEIAGTLNLSVNTVKSYIRSCYRKIDVASRSRAVVWGLTNGFGDTPADVHSQADEAVPIDVR